MKIANGLESELDSELESESIFQAGVSVGVAVDLNFADFATLCRSNSRDAVWYLFMICLVHKKYVPLKD